MPWFDRLNEAAYNSPSGVRIVFDYENVSREFDKKTTAFSFADADGTYVQDNGLSGRRYPLRIFFWGDDHDLEAQAFVDAISERGAGRLEHPQWGTATVLPFGAIAERSDLKTAANQTVFEVTFWDTIDAIYPLGQGDASSAVLGAVGEYNEALAAQFESATDLDTAGERATFRNDYLAALGNAKSGLEAIADTQADVQSQFNAISGSIEAGINTLVGEPLTLASQTTLLLQAPARAATSIQARLSAYRDLASAIISGDGAVVSPGLDSKNSNRFHSADLYASTYVSGSVVSAVNTEFATKTDALAAADEILQQFEQVVQWRDANYRSLSQVDTGGAYQQLLEAVGLCVGFLVEISFTLKQERRVVLDRDRCFIDLCAELYGQTDEVYDFFIKSNNLSGSEYLEIKQGREIVYYV